MKIPITLQWLTAAEMHVAAQRAERYPPGNSMRWAADPQFTGDSFVAVQLLEKHPELLEAG